MGTVTFTHVFDGSEPIGGLILSSELPPFTGAFSCELRLNTPATAIVNFTVSFAILPAATSCYRQGVSIGAGQTNNGFTTTVGNPPFAWSCTNWNRLIIGYDSATNRAPLGSTLTVSLSGDGIPAVPCAFGSRPRATSPGWEIFSSFVFDEVLAAHPEFWWLPVIDVFFGTAVNVQELCSGPPPPLEEVPTKLLGNPGRAALDVLRATLWPYYCECIPGTPSPVPPPLPDPAKPGDWPPAPTYVLNPSNPCLSLSEVLERLDQVLRATGNIGDLTRAVQRYTAPFATIDGPTFSSLTGEGQVSVERAVGFRVKVISPPPPLVIQSTPDYWWDVGWMSVSDGGAMLQQRRIARQVTQWLPTQCQLATFFGWYLKPGQTIEVTVLLAEA